MAGSRCIFVSVLYAVLSIGLCIGKAQAQDRFDSDDMAGHSGYSGYTTYHHRFREPQGLPVHEYDQIELLTDRKLYGAEEEVRAPVRNTSKAKGGILLAKEPPATRVETFYRERSKDDDLTQFGYNMFYHIDKNRNYSINEKDFQREDVVAPMGAVQGDYILQIGDEVTLAFEGERKDRVVQKIQTDGRLFVEGFSPLTLAGETLAVARDRLNSLLLSYGYQGDVHMSVSGIRRIGVLVAGHVMKPGRHDMNAFHSVLDALQMAGGVRKTGSLRQIRLIRGGKTIIVDLYDFLMNAKMPADIRLADGDRIIVPPLGPTVAVTGDVKQPGIFELRPDLKRAWRGMAQDVARKVTVSDVLVMAGGVLGAGDTVFTVTDEQSNVFNIVNNQYVVGDSSIINVIRSIDRFDNAVTLKGHSRKNGLYDIATASSLHKLLGDGEAFAEDIYPLIGVITRMNRRNMTRTMMGFSPQAIARGIDDRQLEAGDNIYLFSRTDIDEIMTKKDEPALTEEEEDALHTRIAAQTVLDTVPPMNGEILYPDLVIDFVRDNVVTLQGAVRRPGAWPVGMAAGLDSLISVAGGLNSRASIKDIEVVTATDGTNNRIRKKIDGSNGGVAKTIIMPGDQVRINERFEKTVAETIRITGEIRHPGTYDLMRGDTLLTVLERAGGVTDDAYPPGAVFSRRSERKREEQRFRAAAQDLERTVSVSLNAKDKGGALTPEQISMARGLADDLRAIRAIGRMTVEADPVVLQARPELDLLLEGGDHIHIPKRPLNVRVAGEVLNPATLLFEKHKKASDYINEAGGVTYYADKGRGFILYPDGRAHPMNGGWGGAPDMIIPGSTIVVPRDPKPYSFMDGFKDITQILTNMAITGVFIEDIATDEN